MSSQGSILQAAATGSHDAFASLVRQYQGPVRRFLLRMTQGDAMRADDLAQETFIRAWQHLRDFRAEAAFRTWLTSIAYRLFLDEQRKAKQQTLSLDDSTQGIAALASAQPSAKAAGMSIDIDSALATLSEAERTCVTLQCIEGYSIRDIAEITSMNENTVKSHLLRGKQHLAAFLRKNGYG